MNFLEKIVKEKQALLQEQKKVVPEAELIQKLAAINKNSRFKNILGQPGTHLIAEIKRASPSKGDLRPDLDILEIARLYQQEGVELVSVLAEENYFKGSLSDLAQVSKNTELSILCKDFIIDSYQVREAKLHGAEAILLIVRILSVGQLKKLLAVAKSINMDTVVEIHDEADLIKIASSIPEIEIIGINNRNLEDFSVDLNTTLGLFPKIPSGKLVIVESGISSSHEAYQFKKMGLNGVLVGESLMKQKDIGRKIKEFVSALK